MVALGFASLTPTYGLAQALHEGTADHRVSRESYSFSEIMMITA